MIKIKLGIADSDLLYLNRLTKLFSSQYKNQIEIYSFSESSCVAEAVRENKINVLLVSQDANVHADTIADYCVFAYLVDSRHIDEFNSCKTICKYQRADIIYRQILGLYSEKLSDKVKYRNSSGKNASVSLFVSGCDGAGASTTAAAYAAYLAQHGKKTLYLNIKQFSDTESLFNGIGNGTFTDAIFAVKSRKSNLTLKLESIVRQSQNGVFFFTGCKDPLDYTEINAEELRYLINELSGSFGYDYIVLVSDFYFSDKLAALLEISSDVVIVSEGNRNSQIQLVRKSQAIGGLEKRLHSDISGKLKILFNKTKFLNTFCTDIPVIGIQPELEQVDENEIVRMISTSDIFDSLYKKEAAV